MFLNWKLEINPDILLQKKVVATYGSRITGIGLVSIDFDDDTSIEVNEIQLTLLLKGGKVAWHNQSAIKKALLFE